MRKEFVNRIVSEKYVTEKDNQESQKLKESQKVYL